MTDDKKDVVIHVTGVSMSGKVRDDSNRLTPKDQRELGREEARDSEGDDWRSDFRFWVISKIRWYRRRLITGIWDYRWNNEKVR